MNGGTRSGRPPGTMAGHVPFEDLLYRGTEGLLVAPPPRSRLSRAAGNRYNMFLGTFIATSALILAAVIIWAAISSRSPEHLDPYQMSALLIIDLTMSVLVYLLALEPDETI
ncbi:unnamed protein product [Alopecurus aequalis]